MKAHYFELSAGIIGITEAFSDREAFIEKTSPSEIITALDEINTGMPQALKADVVVISELSTTPIALTASILKKFANINFTKPVIVLKDYISENEKSGIRVAESRGNNITILMLKQSGNGEYSPDLQDLQKTLDLVTAAQVEPVSGDWTASATIVSVPEQERYFSFRGFSIDGSRENEFLFRGLRFGLTEMKFKLFTTLLGHKSEEVTADQLRTEIYGPNSFDKATALTGLIRSLRQDLSKFGFPDELIEIIDNGSRQKADYRINSEFIPSSINQLSPNPKEARRLLVERARALTA